MDQNNLNTVSWQNYIQDNTIKIPFTLSDNIYILYQEMIMNIKQKCFTASLLLMRKMLVHIAVHIGDEAHESFAEYLIYIEDELSLSEKSSKTLNHLRIEANQVNHETILASPKYIIDYLHALNEILSLC